MNDRVLIYPYHAAFIFILTRDTRMSLLLTKESVKKVSAASVTSSSSFSFSFIIIFAMFVQQRSNMCASGGMRKQQRRPNNYLLLFLFERLSQFCYWGVPIALSQRHAQSSSRYETHPPHSLLLLSHRKQTMRGKCVSRIWL